MTSPRTYAEAQDLYDRAVELIEEAEADPNADLIGYVVVTESGGFVVMETSPELPSYVNCDELDPSGKKIGQTCRPAALLRQAKARES